MRCSSCGRFTLTAARISDDPAALTGVVDHPTSSCLLAVADARIVGSILTGWDGWCFSLYRLAVATTHRRQAVGTKLVEARRRASALGAAYEWRSR